MVNKEIFITKEMISPFYLEQFTIHNNNALHLQKIMKLYYNKTFKIKIFEQTFPNYDMYINTYFTHYISTMYRHYHLLMY